VRADEFTFGVDDGAGGSDTGTVTVEISPAVVVPPVVSMGAARVWRAPPGRWWTRYVHMHV
jgi:hypothetical protein